MSSRLAAALIGAALIAAAGTTAAAAAPASRPEAGGDWPLWTSYKARFIDSQGRVVDRHSADSTTSEAQAYTLFFALVANDRPQFDRLLEWTRNNLADGDFTARLPSWSWGKSASGEWGVLDANAAADADLWLAYTLLEASELWAEPRFARQGRALAKRIAAEEVRELEGLGPMLLPGPRGFHPYPDVYQLNPSYLALHLLLGLARHIDDGPWGEIARLVPRVIEGGSANGFALDWTAYRENQGFHYSSPPGAPPTGGYDAIRVYLWAGLLHPDTPRRAEILRAVTGLADYLDEHPQPPAGISAAGEVTDAGGGVGFSAAAIPYLSALGRSRALATQQQRLAAELDPATGLYGGQFRYYDQVLALFSTGWSEARFGFDPRGALNVAWR